VTGIHKDSVRRWNLRFPSAGVFAKVLAGRATRTQITFPPPVDCHIGQPASVAQLIASRYALPGDRRVWVRGPGWLNHCVRL